MQKLVLEVCEENIVQTESPIYYKRKDYSGNLGLCK